jgi:BAR domain
MSRKTRKLNWNKVIWEGNRLIVPKPTRMQDLFVSFCLHFLWKRAEAFGGVGAYRQYLGMADQHSIKCTGSIYLMRNVKYYILIIIKFLISVLYPCLTIFTRLQPTQYMSWKGFTKAINRLPAIIAKQTGSQQETKDQEFSLLYESFKQIDIDCRLLSSETRKYKDSLTLVLFHQQTLAEHLNQLTTSEATKEFISSMTKCRQDLQQDLEQLERLVVGPTTDLIMLLDNVKRFFVKREHKLLDYDRFGEQVKGLKDKLNRTVAGLRFTYLP